MLASEPQHDPGGRPRIIPGGVVVNAQYGGKDRCYRYLLDWHWSDKPVLMVGMMNPSCANHLIADQTLLVCYGWAFNNGYGRLLVVNADAYRAADQRRLAEVEDPRGPENDKYILQAASEAYTIVMAYGEPKVKAVQGHGVRMANLLKMNGYSLNAWKLTKAGNPRHPLMSIGFSTPLIPFME